MKEYSAFDILGPVMIGPSSSHTAGAARLGKAAKEIVGEEIKSVLFTLHGSFAKTYMGHGTDKALVAGIIGLEPDDPLLIKSFQLAYKKGLLYSFAEDNISGAHPNTVKMDIVTISDKTVEVIGSSIGGGNIVINSINGQKLKFTGQYPTVITKNEDKPGVISKVTTILANNNLNVANMYVYRYLKGSYATMLIEIDQHIDKKTVKEINDLDEVIQISFINKL